MASIQSATTAVNSNAPAPTERWELVVQWRRAIKTFRIVASVIMVLVALLVLSEALRFYDLFTRIHSLAGYIYIVLLVVGLFVLVGIPAWRYWRVPTVLRPPDVHFDEDRLQHADLVKRVRFVARYCQALRKNPELASKSEQIAQIARRATGMRQKVKSARGDAMTTLVGEIRQFETKTIDPLLKELDAKVDAYIRKEAFAVGVGTAVCTSGTLDAFVVLWRAANMVSRISRFYYGRPGLHGSLVLLGDVASAVVLSRAADNLTDMVGDLAAETPGMLKAIPGMNIFAGPILDGTINTVMMMRVGYLAKRRCRSFEAWDKKAMHKAVAEVVQSVARETASISKELANQVSNLVWPYLNSTFKAAAAAAGAGADAAKDAIRGGGWNAWLMLQGLLGGSTDRPDDPMK
jgi:uncharacterized membrane protein YcjF (UPF0283 family)